MFFLRWYIMFIVYNYCIIEYNFKIISEMNRGESIRVYLCLVFMFILKRELDWVGIFIWIFINFRWDSFLFNYE